MDKVSVKLVGGPHDGVDYETYLGISFIQIPNEDDYDSMYRVVHYCEAIVDAKKEKGERVIKYDRVFIGQYLEPSNKDKCDKVAKGLIEKSMGEKTYKIWKKID